MWQILCKLKRIYLNLYLIRYLKMCPTVQETHLNVLVIISQALKG